MLTASLVAIGLAGFGLGRVRPKIELVYLVFAVFASVSAHSAIQYAFIDGRLDIPLGDPREPGREVLVVPIAAGEAIGMWLPFILLPWAQMSARLWGAFYCIATAVLAAIYYYFPFDPVILDKSLISGFGPPYLVTVFVGLPLAAIGWVFGWMRAMSHSSKTDDFDIPVAP